MTSCLISSFWQKTYISLASFAILETADFFAHTCKIHTYEIVYGDPMPMNNLVGMNLVTYVIIKSSCAAWPNWGIGRNAFELLVEIIR